MTKYIILTALILISVLIVVAMISRDDRTSNNLTSAIKDGSEEAVQKTLGRARNGAVRIAFEIKHGVRSTADAVNESVRRADQMTLDASCTAAIKMKFVNDETVPASQIDVETQNGIVTLYGSVATPEQAERAVELASNVEGVVRVISRLQVRQSA